MGKDERKKVFFPQLFRPKVFDMDFPKKFFMVFLNSPCWETHKNAMGKDERKKVFFSQLFRPKVFDMDFPKKFFVVFLNSPCWETHKNAIKKRKKKGGTYLPDLSSARCTSLSFAFWKLFPSAPLVLRHDAIKTWKRPLSVLWPPRAAPLPPPGVSWRTSAAFCGNLGGARRPNYWVLVAKSQTERWKPGRPSARVRRPETATQWFQPNGSGSGVGWGWHWRNLMPWLQTRSIVPCKLHIYGLNLQMVWSFESLNEFDIGLNDEVRASGKTYKTKLCCLQANLCRKWNILCRLSPIYKMTSFSTHMMFRNATFRRGGLR